ncbi:hypothetical protein HL658_17090 [Azospirillum sp. RWY-5-1]|uniref:Uncharacterized protein n=1 Tax=Azospirillum oleiclasticum TaxID=2735135 RepID=A0ABX2TC60_9PROT|nr:T3SS effector HopA1 family protein [Azospirillum oleiclasticum]NYZ14274.1 hypothetical protein [Azospirillum oleiclasticum]NYZ21759.1 hypothetical protein [Azospirillum oleiclasticum]
MPTAADKYEDNIRFFAGLRARTGSFKLEYDRNSGLFKVAGNFVKRTFGNKGSGEHAQSVTNDTMFKDPIVSVFKAAFDARFGGGLRWQAYNGLCNLRRAYPDGDKRRSLEATLTAVQPYTKGGIILDLEDQLRTIQPENVLGPLDLDFMRQVWLNRAPLFNLLDRATGADRNTHFPDHKVSARPYASLANAIYRLYNGHIEPKIADPALWAMKLPRIYKKGAGFGLSLQHTKTFVPAGSAGTIASNHDQGTDFIYYSTHREHPGQQLWRIYLNFPADSAPKILMFLMANAKRRAIHSFKIAGPLAFHTRKDKIVIYVSLSQRDNLVADLQGKAATFKFADPVPGMTIGRHPGIAIGVEPTDLETGFSGNLDPKMMGRQSYGSIRAELIAMALTNMHAAAEDLGGAYLNDETTFLKWVAIAFKAHAANLNPGA